MASFRENLIVRCPIDEEYEDHPKEFAVGKIVEYNDFSDTVHVRFYGIGNVKKYHVIPQPAVFSTDDISRCRIRQGAIVSYIDKEYKVVYSVFNKEEDLFWYYISSNDTVIYVKETDLICSFNDGYVDPKHQLVTYEFQNPKFFQGRYNVSKGINALNNSLYGFKEIAGCRVFLKPYQISTILRCFEREKVRVMLADEVGMGKTIEALAVLKLYLIDHHDVKVCIAVPSALKEQWKTEMAFKFHIFEGSKDDKGNRVDLITYDELEIMKDTAQYNFVIADEIHRAISNTKLYDLILKISQSVENIILLSATPIQQRESEYKKLLCLVEPNKYIGISDDKFNEILSKQKRVMRDIYRLLDELDAYEEEIKLCEGERCVEIEEEFDEVLDSLERLGKTIKDKRFDGLVENLSYDDEDFSMAKIKSIVAYVCDGYQLNRNIVRNRRQTTDEEGSPVNIRKVETIAYDVQTDMNIDEHRAYQYLSSWIESQTSTEEIFEENFKPIISAFFSSAHAYWNVLRNIKLAVPDDIIRSAELWLKHESEMEENGIAYMLDDPFESQSRIVNIVDYIDQETGSDKVLLFTEYQETFGLYKNILTDYFGDECCCFFSENMDRDTLELNAYRFQSNDKYRIMLSDKSGGEGRNFQNAAYVVHIDTPWDINEIEQRIGRLDRIGRKEGMPVVSVVCYAENTIENSVFDFFQNSLGIFSQTQTGLDIMAEEINKSISKYVSEDFRYGLEKKIPEFTAYIECVRDAVKDERHFDIAQYIYKNSNTIIDRNIHLFNENETDYFVNSMMEWADRVGFNGEFDQKKKTVLFTKRAFSLGSAKKTTFIPPDMINITQDNLNVMQNRIRELNGEFSRRKETEYVRGTFDRKAAIANDYIHFFAPGDEIFDSITDNAMNSYRGTCSAFSAKSSYNWQGIVFTWRIEENPIEILKNGYPLHALEKYKGYLSSDLITTTGEIYSTDKYEETEIINEFKKILKGDMKDVVNIGEREDRSGHGSQLERFKAAIPVENWKKIVAVCYNKAFKSASAKASKYVTRQISRLNDQLQSDYRSLLAQKGYYDDTEDGNERELFSAISKALSNSRLVLDSVCYMRLSK